MKRKALVRGIWGIPIGVMFGYLITIVLSLLFGNGDYSPCAPGLVDVAGNEMNAVLLQNVMCGLLGASFAASSVIWEDESWGIVKQTGIYLLIATIVMMPIAYLLHWMEHSIMGFIIYFLVFALFFIAIWIIEYLINRRNVQKMNEKLKSSTGR